MGMYDEVKAINVSHDNFDKNHNGLLFQTKSLEVEMFEYCIFNNALYLQAERGGAAGWTWHDKAIKSDHSGTVNIYTDYTRNKVGYWVEYDLILENGEIIDVMAYDVRVTKDGRDSTDTLPKTASNSVCVTISISNCDKEKQGAVAEMLNDDKLDQIRQVLGEPTASIYYPVKREDGSVSSMASVVQRLEDFTENTNQKIGVTAPSADRVIILDEYHSFSNTFLNRKD